MVISCRISANWWGGANLWWQEALDHEVRLTFQHFVLLWSLDRLDSLESLASITSSIVRLRTTALMWSWTDRDQRSTTASTPWTAYRWSRVPWESWLTPLSLALAWKPSSEPHSLALGRPTPKKYIFGTAGTKIGPPPAGLQRYKRQSYI